MESIILGVVTILFIIFMIAKTIKIIDELQGQMHCIENKLKYMTALQEDTKEKVIEDVERVREEIKLTPFKTKKEFMGEFTKLAPVKIVVAEENVLERLIK